MTELGAALSLMLEATARYQCGDVTNALYVMDQAITETANDRERRMMKLQKIGWLRESGSPEKADQLARQAERDLAGIPPDQVAAEWGHLCMERGILALQRGELDAAESYLTRSEQIVSEMQADDQELMLPTILANKAGVLLEKGRLSQARDVVMRALEMDRRLGDDRSEAHDLNLLGIINQNIGNIETARAYFSQSSDVAKAGGLTNYAAQASSNLDALSTRRAPDGEDNAGFGIDQACTVSNEGVVALRNGDHDRAAKLFRKAWKLHLDVGNATHSIHDRLNLSAVEVVRGYFDEAITVAHSALQEARTSGLSRILWFAEYRYAEIIIESIGKGIASARERAPEALESIGKAMDLIELLRIGIDHPEDRQWLLAGKEEVYALAFTIYVQSDPAKAFDISERARARAFLELVGSSRISRIEQSSAAACRRKDLISQVMRSDIGPSELSQLIGELSQVRSEIVAESPEIAPLTGDALPDLAEICAAIPDDGRLVNFFLLNKTALAVFLLSRQGMQMCYLTRLFRPIDEAVAELREQIENGEALPALGYELFKELFVPLIDGLEDVTNLLIVPHGALNHVPWSVLWFPTDQLDESVPKQLLLRNRFLITLLPSATYLPLQHQPSRPWNATGIVLGDPTGELPGAADEAQLVADLLGVRPFIGREATRATLLDANRPTVVHICCHGRFDNADPLLSGLELADGILSVEDLLEQGPAAKLTVFSACLSGLSGQRVGDELVGLARAALSNGGRTVIATLWAVSDESSAAFFSYFYDAMRRGATARHALFYAQTYVPKNHPEFADPFDWGPFSLIGDPDTRLLAS